MKSRILTSALVAVSFLGSAFAYTPTPEQAAAAAAARPVPSKIVNPERLPMRYAGSLIQIEFSLDKSGRPQDIKVLSSEEVAVKKQVIEAFRQWRFDGVTEAVAGQKRFVLPLQLVPERV
jgi:TonB family protein